LDPSGLSMDPALPSQGQASPATFGERTAAAPEVPREGPDPLNLNQPRERPALERKISIPAKDTGRLRVDQFKVSHACLPSRPALHSPRFPAGSGCWVWVSGRELGRPCQESEGVQIFRPKAQFWGEITGYNPVQS
jgi:hypothetical protein